MKEVSKLQAESKSHKKLWIILGVILICLIVIYLIVRTIMVAYIVQVGTEEMENVLLRQANSFLRLPGEERPEETGNINELKQRLRVSKNVFQNQINDLKETGKTKIWVSNITILCDDGSIIYPGEIGTKRCGGETINDGSFVEIEFEGNNNLLVISMVLPIILITLSEDSIASLENLKDSKSSVNNLIPAILDTLLNLVREISSWQFFDGVFMLDYNETNLINQDLGEGVRVLEEFSKNLESPTEEEIKNIQLKEFCIKAFEEVAEDERTVYSSAFETSFFENILFIRRSIPKICKKLESSQKERAIRMLEENANEQNPFRLLEKKLHLNLLVQCTGELFPKMGQEKECTNNYIENLQADLLDALNTTKKEGSCRDSDECSDEEFCSEEDMCRTGCEETDSGKDYYLLGAVEIVGGGGFDSCDETTGILTEYYCVDEENGEWSIGSEEYSCPNGCVYGGECKRP